MFWRESQVQAGECHRGSRPVSRKAVLHGRSPFLAACRSEALASRPLTVPRGLSQRSACFTAAHRSSRPVAAKRLLHGRSPFLAACRSEALASRPLHVPNIIRVFVAKPTGNAAGTTRESLQHQPEA